MSSLSALVDKELRTLFEAPIAWIVIGVFLGLMGYSFTLTLFNNRYATLVHIFFQVAGLLLLIVPIITMRLLRGWSPRITSMCAATGRRGVIAAITGPTRSTAGRASCNKSGGADGAPMSISTTTRRAPRQKTPRG